MPPPASRPPRPSAVLPAPEVGRDPDTPRGPVGRLRAATRRWTTERPAARRSPAAALAVIGGALAGTAVDRLAASLTANLTAARTSRPVSGPLGTLRTTLRVRPPGFPSLLHAATGRQAPPDVSATASYGELCRLRRGCDALGNTWDDPAYALMSLFGGYAGVFGDSCGPVFETGSDTAPSLRTRWTEITYGGGERLSVGTEIGLGNRSLPIRIIGIPLVRDGRLALLPDEIVLGNQRLPGELMTPADTAVFAEPVVILPAFPRGTRLADAVATPEGLRLRFERCAPAGR
ncbi:hypothetical protein CC117_09170 [Parafrankia colletiae]|uniref:Uncharacterized protein n=1 Tax=Parafrankia colletiae TaxID=573497 RepID=A0A1S1RI67_9ACTN|nr:hypothetical protein [Parafrankia colletiae]MCK9899247.1 hypothetical protein [Frankia sp. Cpl3]OHV45920.1 hypothetical protein CC117_09170 [Parafrankia colletiae]